MKNLVLIRHGESEWNLANRFTGWTDVDLSEKGIREAKNGGIQLKKEGFDFDICYTSYLKRAIHTLNNVLFEMDREWLRRCPYVLYAGIYHFSLRQQGFNRLLH